MLTQPVQNDIDIYKDRDFRKTFELEDASGKLLNINNWSFAAQIRPAKGSSVLLIQFTVSISTYASTVVISLTDDQTLDLNVENRINVGSTTTSSNCYWDFVATNGAGYRYSLIEGIATIHETVTRRPVT
jgi:hypothetical protein